MGDYFTVVLVVCKALYHLPAAISQSDDAALVVSVVVEGSVSVGDAKRRIDTLIVGDRSDHVVLLIEDGDDVIAVVEILPRYPVFGFADSSAKAS